MCGNAITSSSNTQHPISATAETERRSKVQQLPSSSKRPLIAVVVMLVSMIVTYLNIWSLAPGSLVASHRWTFILRNAPRIFDPRNFHIALGGVWQTLLFLLPILIFAIIALTAAKKNLLFLLIPLALHIIIGFFTVGLSVIMLLPVLVFIFICLVAMGVVRNKRVLFIAFIIVTTVALVILLHTLPRMIISGNISFAGMALGGSLTISTIAYLIMLFGSSDRQDRKHHPTHHPNPLPSGTDTALPQTTATHTPLQNNTEEKTIEWYQAEIARLESLQNEKVWYLAIGGIVLGVAVFALFNFIGNVTNVNFIDIGVIGILLIIGGVGIIPFNMYTKKKRTAIIADLKKELTALYSSQNENP